LHHLRIIVNGKAVVVTDHRLDSRLRGNDKQVIVPAQAGTYTNCELRKPLVLSDVLDLPHEGWTGPDSVCEGVICC